MISGYLTNELWRIQLQQVNHKSITYECAIVHSIFFHSCAIAIFVEYHRVMLVNETKGPEIRYVSILTHVHRNFKRWFLKMEEPQIQVCSVRQHHVWMVKGVSRMKPRFQSTFVLDITTRLRISLQLIYYNKWYSSIRAQAMKPQKCINKPDTWMNLDGVVLKRKWASDF